MKLRREQWPPPGDALCAPAALIRALLPMAEGWSWSIGGGPQGLDISGGPGYPALMAWHEQGTRVRTTELLRELDRSHRQLNWGVLAAYEAEADDPILTITAFDSTWYDIEGPEALVSGLPCG